MYLTIFKHSFLFIGTTWRLVYTGISLILNICGKRRSQIFGSCGWRFEGFLHLSPRTLSLRRCHKFITNSHFTATVWRLNLVPVNFSVMNLSECDVEDISVDSQDAFQESWKYQRSDLWLRLVTRIIFQGVMAKAFQMVSLNILMLLQAMEVYHLI